jgi:hypothetical protein
LCVFAIVEGLEDYILDWAFVRVTDETSALEGARQYNVWRGRLLSQLVCAHDFLDNENSGNSMIRSVFAMVDKKKALADDGSAAPVVSLQPAKAICYTKLCDKVGSKTDVTLFEKFMAWWYLTTTNMMFRQGEARLKLHHPQRPSETDAVKWLRGWDGSSPHDKARKFDDRFLQRTVDIATKNNNTEAVKWIKDKFRDRLDPRTDRFAPPTKAELQILKYERNEAKRRHAETYKRRDSIITYY